MFSLPPFLSMTLNFITNCFVEMVTIPAQKDDKFSDTVIDIMRKIEECIKDIPRWFSCYFNLTNYLCNRSIQSN